MHRQVAFAISLGLAGLSACREATPPPEIVRSQVEAEAPRKAVPLACNDDLAAPLSCAYLPARTKACATASDALPGCRRLAMALHPRAREAAMRCLYNRSLDPCDVYEPDAMADCFLAALSSACPDPRAQLACAGVVATCDGQIGNELTMPVCAAAYSAVIESQREELLSCAASRCNPSCFDHLSPGESAPSARPPPPRERHAPEATAKWPDAKLPMPPSWTACKIDTDCEVAVGACCEELAVGRMYAPFAYHTLDRVVDTGCAATCTYHPRAACEAGRCVLVASVFPPATGLPP